MEGTKSEAQSPPNVSISERDDAILVVLAKKWAAQESITDPTIITQKVQEYRRQMQNGWIPAYHTKKMQEAIEQGKPFDKAMHIAYNPEHQAELDKRNGATTLDLLRRRLIQAARPELQTTK